MKIDFFIAMFSPNCHVGSDAVRRSTMQESFLSQWRGVRREKHLTQRRKATEAQKMKNTRHPKKTPGTSKVPGVFPSSVPGVSIEGAWCFLSRDGGF